jgi:hypothetical protein
LTIAGLKVSAQAKTAMSIGKSSTAPSGRRGLFSLLSLVAVLLFVILSALFFRSYQPRQVLFSNDGPYGGVVCEFNRMPGTMTGVWRDLNWLGNEDLSPAPTISTFLRLVTYQDPMIYSKWFCPFSLFFAGLCACFCFRKFQLAPLACVLGGLVAALNSDFLSTACWGVASQIVGFGANYLALGLLAGNGSRRQWLRVILAGMAVGVGIMEAYDIGAIFSLYVAAFIFYHAVFLEAGEVPAKIGRGILRIALVAGFAAFISFHALTTLVGTQLKGIAAAQSDKKEAWNFATQWSLPKAETLQIIIPGFFGYRLESPGGLNYWGTIGSNPLIPDMQKILKDPNSTPAMLAQAKGLLDDAAQWRFSGTGFYAGIPVVLIALWAAFQSFRGEGSFTESQRRAIRFWAGAAAISLPLAYGKYAPFFWFFYHLPHASAIRNPTKFMHVFNFALVILFAYGIHGFLIAYLKDPVARVKGVFAQFRNWFATSAAFERRWLLGCAIAWGAGLLGWFLYAASASHMKSHLETIGIDPAFSAAAAAYSLRSVGWFVLFMALSTLLLGLIFSGQFSGARAKWGAMLLVALVLFDLARADVPWIVYWDVDYKYAANPIIDALRDKPYEQRVDAMPYGSSTPMRDLFTQVFNIEWHQQLFLYYNIQALRVVMEPRVTVDKDLFLAALPLVNATNWVRYWELTNTRYLIGDSGQKFINFLNQSVDPVKKRFRMLKLPDGHPATFNLAPKPGYSGTVLSDYTAELDPNGQLGVVEFTGALPRASLYSNWQVNTNDQAVLQLLASPDFDPHTSVLISDPEIPASLPANLVPEAGTVEINPNYRSKRIELSADVKTPSVLLLVERYNPKWQVEVDGQPARLLRCDFIMRGVYLTPGRHHIVMRFVTPLATLYVSLAAIALGLVICGYLAFTKWSIS